MPLQVYSTLTRKKEPFPKQPGETVTIYLCGPTVYKPSHIGHMVGPVIFDTVKRYLTYLGFKVKWVVNITDVDDKLIKRAAELGTTVPELASRMTADYIDCLTKLNVRMGPDGIDEMPKATDHIPGMIAMIARLIAKSYAYPAGGDVYFDVSKDADYGKLCNRDPQQLEAGSRIEVSDRKRNPGDFALWKGAKPGEPKDVIWDSPWGPGRPGWHIECSVMSQALLGGTLDIHGGGLDLQFPHHENELAQSESDTDKPFARVWMHNGLLKMRSGKMAGSIGNVLNVVDAVKLVSGEVLRFFVLNTHYRSPIDLGDWEPKPDSIPSGLESAKRACSTFARFIERFQRIAKADFYTSLHLAKSFHDPELDEFRTRFREHMDDDFNTGGATGVLFELVTALNKRADAAKLEDPSTPDGIQKIQFVEGASLLKEFGQILGLFWVPPPHAIRAAGIPSAEAFGLPTITSASGNSHTHLVGGLMQLLIDLRNNLRAEAKKIAGKDDPTKKALFEQTDVIRKRLGELGVILEDRPGGTAWRKA